MEVVVEGSVDGKIVNKGGRLVVNNKVCMLHVLRLMGLRKQKLAVFSKHSLYRLLYRIGEKLAKYAAAAECAAVVKGNAYGCGIEPIAGALAKTGCRTFSSPIFRKPSASRCCAKRNDLCPPWAVLWNRTGLRRNQCATCHL